MLKEELKNKVAADWFAAFDTTRIIGKVDFCVAVGATELGLCEGENALWAEAKAGVRKDIHESFVQLTCGALWITPPTNLTTVRGAMDANSVGGVVPNAPQSPSNAAFVGT